VVITEMSCSTYQITRWKNYKNRQKKKKEKEIHKTKQAAKKFLQALNLNKETHHLGRSIA